MVGRIPLLTGNTFDSVCSETLKLWPQVEWLNFLQFLGFHPIIFPQKGFIQFSRLSRSISYYSTLQLNSFFGSLCACCFCRINRTRFSITIRRNIIISLTSLTATKASVEAIGTATARSVIPTRLGQIWSSKLENFLQGFPNIHLSSSRVVDTYWGLVATLLPSSNQVTQRKLRSQLNAFLVHMAKLYIATGLKVELSCLKWSLCQLIYLINVKLCTKRSAICPSVCPRVPFDFNYQPVGGSEFGLGELVNPFKFIIILCRLFGF